MRRLVIAVCGGLCLASQYLLAQSALEVVESAGDRLLASDAEAYDRMGHSVSLAGQRVVVGAFQSDVFAEDGGAVYIYERSAGSWFETAKLGASDAAAGDFFGYLLAGDGDRIVVGAYLDNHEGGEDAGSAYVYRWDNDSAEWIEEDKLTASDAAPFDRFGRFVAIDGERIAVGAYRNADAGMETGSAYVFVWDEITRTWIEEAKLLASDASAGDRFGRFVAIDGDLVVVAADQQDESASDSGAVYIFERQNGQPPAWEEVVRLKPSDPDQNQRFGSFVGIDGETVVVGADLDDEAAENAGAVYVFDRTGIGETGWQETIKLTASDADVLDRFGVSVAIEDERLLVGASRDDEHANEAGAAYLLTSRSGVWELEAKLLADDGNPGDALGFSVALGAYIVSGAETLDVLGNGETLIDAGGAYVLDRPFFFDGFENGDLSPWDSVGSS